MLNRLVLIVFIILVIISALYALRDTKEYTTSSLEAHQLYLESKDLRNKLYRFEAIEKLNEALKLDSNFSIVLLELALVAKQYEEHEKSDKLMARVMAQYDNLKEYEKFNIDIVTEYIDGNAEQSRVIAKKYIEKYPDRIDGHQLIATEAWDRGDIKTAIHEFEEILRIDPEFAPSYNSLGYLEFGNGDFQKALEHFDRYLKLLPDQANPHDSRGEILMAVGRYDEALQEFKTAQQIEPKFKFVLSHMADVYTFKGMYGKVDQIYEKIEKLNQFDMEKEGLKIQQLRSFINRGDTSSAFKLANTFINTEIDKNNAMTPFWGHILKAQALFKFDLNRANQHLENAQAIFNENFAKSSKENMVLETQGWLTVTESLIGIKSGNFQNVLELEKLTNTDKIWRPDALIDIKNILAHGYFNLDRKEDAFKLIQENLALNPNHPSTHLFMAEMFEMDGNIPMAVKHYEKLMDIYRDADEKFVRLQKFKDKLTELSALAQR